MKKSGLHRLLGAGAMAGLGVVFLTGCNNNTQQVVSVTREPYEKISYQTVEVQRGNLSATVTLELMPEGYEEITYKVAKEELKLEEVHVSVGDRVQKGDILVSFESERLKETIAEYEDAKKQNELLVEHYERLMEIDSSMDYKTDIKMLKEDIRVANLYIEEANNMLMQYQIIAKEDGVITEISEYLQNGVIEPGSELLTEICGTGRYQTVTTETDIFEVGNIYNATDGMNEYEVRLLDMTDGVLVFEPVSDMSLLIDDENLMLTVEKPEMKDVVYVDRFAVREVEANREEDNTYYVYVMQENGYQRAVRVTPGERVGDYTVITEGLEGGEKVVIQ